MLPSITRSLPSPGSASSNSAFPHLRPWLLLEFSWTCKWGLGRSCRENVTASRAPSLPSASGTVHVYLLHWKVLTLSSSMSIGHFYVPGPMLSYAYTAMKSQAWPLRAEGLQTSRHTNRNTEMQTARRAIKERIRCCIVKRR